MNPEEVARAQLRPGEQLVWSGRRAISLFPIKFIGSLLLGTITGACGLWMLVDSRSFFELFSMRWRPHEVYFFLALMIVGLACLPFRVSWRLAKAWRTVYAITNTRLISIIRFTSTSIAEYHGGDIGQIMRREHWDGTGDIIFGKQLFMSAGGENGPPILRTDEIGFYGVSNPRNVEELIRKLKARHDASSKAE